MRTTLADAKLPGSQIARSIGIAACDPRFVDFVNGSQQRLSEMGKWWGTYRRLYVCLTSGCIVWPREVANVEGFRVCDEGIDLLNEWYEFGEAVASLNRSSDWACGPPALIERANGSQFRDIDSLAKIRIYPAVAADAGVKVLLQGFDGNNQPIRTLVGGVYVDGEQITLAVPFATSTFQFKTPGLTGVQKPITKGRLNVYAVDPTTLVETRIAIWEASETNPTYRRSFMPNLPTCCASPACPSASDGCAPSPTPSCSTIQGEAIVRLEFIPATVESDWLFISNVPAVCAGARALMHEERNQKQEAEIEWARAKRILRNELEKYSPNGLTRINARPHGSADPRRVFAGFV